MSPRGALAAMREVVRDLAGGGYPAFVTGGALPRGQVPVFVLHSLEPVSFERRLRHLARNGYATLGADELVEVVAGRREAPERAVALTIDDGRGSVWGVGRPLLEQYGMKAIVFLVPGRMGSRPGPPLPDWDDVRAGRAAAAEVSGRDDGEHGLLYWEEVEALAASGRFDFQSHTLRHARVHTAPRLAGFVTPRDRRGYAAFDVPLIRDGAADLEPAALPLGTPLLASAPRLSGSVRFFEDEAPRRACAERVESGGGERFFERPAWRDELRRVWQAAAGRERGELEAAERRAEAWREELLGSKRLIEERLGRPVRHVCFPWHASTGASERLAHELGYTTLWCGKLPGTPITSPGGDPRRIARIGEDFFGRLPGAGRVGLARVLLGKLGRRLRRTS
jgi:peptidoglycan/xylan/chitin deacetylase (PgdA/CDA1 family)